MATVRTPVPNIPGHSKSFTARSESDDTAKEVAPEALRAARLATNVPNMAIAAKAQIR